MAETEFKYDVFISYSHRDEEWVRNVLVPTLEKQGLKVCIDYRDFIAGKPAIINMQDASETSHHTLLVLTPSWLTSQWTLYESILSRTDDPSGLQRRTIPLLLEKCEPPKFISLLSWVDFTDKQRQNETWQNLFKSLDKEVEEIEIDRGSAEDWHIPYPYPMPPNFTGRAVELQMLDGWLADDKDRLFILRALGGFGKSALAWQWINICVNPAEWTKLVWWSFYEGNASFEHFIEETLKYLKLEVPQGQRPQVDELLRAMQRQKILLILDGFERVLRAYSHMSSAYQGDEPQIEETQLDCVNINAEIFLKSICSLPNIQSKTLMTTRLTPRAVKPHEELLLGCREFELASMQPTDAVEFFHKQGINGTSAQIEAACVTYGYHPLSLRLLIGRILKDFYDPADIIVAQRLRIDGDTKQHQHHVLEVSYNSLPSHVQKLLRTIACFRSSVDLKTIGALTENKDTLIDDLQSLRGRGLLHFDEKHKRFDLHPIVRHYAYEQFEGKERRDTHIKIALYFMDFISLSKVRTPEELNIPIEIFHNMVKAENYKEAILFYNHHLQDPIYYSFGLYLLEIELLEALLSGLFHEKQIDVRIASDLANAYASTGQSKDAISLTEFLSSYDKDNSENRAMGLGNHAVNQIKVGLLKDASESLHKQLEIAVANQHEFEESFGRQVLGRLCMYRGFWEKAQQELELAKKGHGFHSLIPSFQSMNSLLQARWLSFLKKENSHIVNIAIDFAMQAIKEAVNDENNLEPVAKDFVRAYWVLGSAYLLLNKLDLSEKHLVEALTRCRSINNVEYEANILLDLARIRYEQKKYKEANSVANEALMVTERCGYVLEGADVNLFLAQYALEQEKDKTKAKKYAETALKLAYCDGPPYYYKVAYEEAERLLEMLK